MLGWERRGWYSESPERGDSDPVGRVLLEASAPSSAPLVRRGAESPGPGAARSRRTRGSGGAEMDHSSLTHCFHSSFVIRSLGQRIKRHHCFDNEYQYQYKSQRMASEVRYRAPAPLPTPACFRTLPTTTLSSNVREVPTRRERKRVKELSLLDRVLVGH